MSRTAATPGKAKPLASGVASAQALCLPTYDRAYRRFLENAYHGFVAENPLFCEVEYIRDRHTGPIRNVRDEKTLDQPMAPISAGMTIEKAAIRSTDVDAHTLMISAFAEEMLGAQSHQFFANLGEVCNAAGTTVPNIGEGVPTLEQFREMLRKMDISFDDEGRIETQLVVHPSQAEKAKALWSSVQNDPECLRIALEKRARWMELRAARSHRTLPR